MLQKTLIVTFFQGYPRHTRGDASRLLTGVFLKYNKSEAEFLDNIQTKKRLKNFLPCYSQSPQQLCSFALRFLFFQTHATSNSFFSVLLYTVKQKGGNRIENPHPLPYHLRNPYRNLKSENSLCPETLMKLYVHELGFCNVLFSTRVVKWALELKIFV